MVFFPVGLSVIVNLITQSIKVFIGSVFTYESFITFNRLGNGNAMFLIQKSKNSVISVLFLKFH